jgi:hypothetical protein
MSAFIEDINGNIVRIGWLVEVLNGPHASNVGTFIGIRNDKALVTIDGAEVETESDNLLVREQYKPPTLLTQRSG